MKLKLRFKKRQARQLVLCCDNSRPGHWDQPFRWRHLQMLGKIFVKSAWNHLRTNKIMKNTWLKIQGMMETEPWRGWAQHLWLLFLRWYLPLPQWSRTASETQGDREIKVQGPQRIGRVQCAPVTLCWAPKRQDHRSRVNQRVTAPCSSYI